MNYILPRLSCVAPSWASLPSAFWFFFFCLSLWGSPSAAPSPVLSLPLQCLCRVRSWWFSDSYASCCKSPSCRCHITQMASTLVRWLLCPACPIRCLLSCALQHPLWVVE